MIVDYFTLAIRSLHHRLLRTFLTVLGVVIGVAAIIALVTISQGLQNAVVHEFSKIGTDRIYVLPKGFLFPMGTGALNIKDLEVVKDVQEIDYAIGYLVKTAGVEFKREKTMLNIIGWPTEYTDKLKKDYDLWLIEGDYFKVEKYACLVGYLVAEEIFNKEVHAKDKIKINGVEFRVSGVVKEIGSREDDSQIYIPLDTARELFNDANGITAIDAKVRAGEDPESVANKVKRKLSRIRNEKTFDVLTPAQLLEQFGNVIAILQIVLGGIAAISLVVGSVGIANSLYSSVLERINEIGTLKAVGASTKNILSLFLVESAIIGAIGGAIGIIIGVVISYVVGILAVASGFKLMKIIISWKLLVFAFLFSIAIGIISGVMPARSAAKLKPAEALRK